VVVHENRIKDIRKKYMENFMNEENECDHEPEVSSSVKERPADYITMPEVLLLH